MTSFCTIHHSCSSSPETLMAVSERAELVWALVWVDARPGSPTMLECCFSITPHHSGALLTRALPPYQGRIATRPKSERNQGHHGQSSPGAKPTALLIVCNNKSYGHRIPPESEYCRRISPESRVTRRSPTLCTILLSDLCLVTHFTYQSRARSTPLCQ